MAKIATRCIFSSNAVGALWVAIGDRALTGTEFARNLTIDNKDEDAFPGNGWWNGTKIAGGQPDTSSALQRAARVMDEQIKAWRRQLYAQGIGVPPDLVARGDAYLTYGLQAAYLVLTSGSQTDAFKIKYCEEVASGASDVTSPAQFFKIAKDIAQNDVPDSPTSWVSITGAVPQRLQLNAAVGVAGTVPDDVDWAGASWINDLT